MTYVGIIPTLAGPRLATVRYFFTDGLPAFPGWLPAPHQWSNPWWDRIAGLDARWTPGKAPVWSNGALPQPWPGCGCDDVMGAPPCPEPCGQFGYTLVYDGFIDLGGPAFILPPGAANWNAMADRYELIFMHGGSSYAVSFMYLRAAARWQVSWSIDGVDQVGFITGPFALEWHGHTNPADRPFLSATVYCSPV